VKSHKWFAGIDWNALLEKKVAQINYYKLFCKLIPPYKP